MGEVWTAGSLIGGVTPEREDHWQRRQWRATRFSARFLIMAVTESPLLARRVFTGGNRLRAGTACWSHECAFADGVVQKRRWSWSALYSGE